MVAQVRKKRSSGRVGTWPAGDPSAHGAQRTLLQQCVEEVLFRMIFVFLLCGIGPVVIFPVDSVSREDTSATTFAAATSVRPGCKGRGEPVRSVRDQACFSEVPDEP